MFSIVQFLLAKIQIWFEVEKKPHCVMSAAKVWRQHTTTKKLFVACCNLTTANWANTICILDNYNCQFWQIRNLDKCKWRHQTTTTQKHFCDVLQYQNSKTKLMTLWTRWNGFNAPVQTNLWNSSMEPPLPLTPLGWPSNPYLNS